ncbi:uncharacterized protein UDID_18081 [Ustilago sp. UG-2017a]|nr:uncharacterized protein UDID_18081 [Ustilago sp. UG-2017a]
MKAATSVAVDPKVTFESRLFAARTPVRRATGRVVGRVVRRTEQDEPTWPPLRIYERIAGGKKQQQSETSAPTSSHWAALPAESILGQPVEDASAFSKDNVLDRNIQNREIRETQIAKKDEMDAKPVGAYAAYARGLTPWYAGGTLT